jgi:hypothetical protein
VQEGHGYEFAWDFDNDPRTPLDVGWSATAATQSRPFTPTSYEGFRLLVQVDASSDSDELSVDVDEAGTVIGTDLLGPDWDDDPADDESLAPVIGVFREPAEQGESAHGTPRFHVYLRKNSARIRPPSGAGPCPPGGPEGADCFGLGDSFQVGDRVVRQMSVAPVVSATVRVRNAFGNEATERIESVLRAPGVSAPRAEVTIR